MFVVLEGQNGTGKTAVISLLSGSGVLNDHFDAVYFTHHPGATKLGSIIRSMVVEKTHDASPADHLTRQALYLAGMRDFAVAFADMIAAENVLVLCDRYFLSTLVYGQMQGVPVSVSTKFFDTLVGVYPDHTILLEANADEIDRRLSQRPLKNKDIEYTRSYHARAAKLYTAHLQMWPGTVSTFNTTGVPLDFLATWVAERIVEVKDARYPTRPKQNAQQVQQKHGTRPSSEDPFATESGPEDNL